MMTMCSQCWMPIPEGDIIDCACGMPFCIGCYDEHFRDCQDAIRAAGVATLTKKEESDD